VKVKVLAYGVKNAIKKAASQSDEAAEAFVRGMIHEAEKVMTESQLQVPVSMEKGKPGGNLRDSRFVDHKTNRGGAVSTLGYRAEYAIYVHEIAHYRHTVGKYRYLIDPLNAAIPGMADRVAAEVAKATGK
jgi:hypothetical protein